MAHHKLIQLRLNYRVNHTGAITINENHKSTLGDNVLFRPVRQLSINLYEVNADATQTLNDGAVVVLDASPLAANAEKNRNFTENLSIAFDNKYYAILNRQTLNFNDTIFINVGQMKQKNYAVEIIANELGLPHSLEAFLEDTYLKTKKTINLYGTTVVNFSVTDNIASSIANRFRIVFSAAVEGPLPVRITTVQASKINEDVIIEWKTENELNIRHYEVERSTDGINFIKASTVNTNEIKSYTWLDKDALISQVYYRIKSIDISGAIQYSKIVKLVIDNQNTALLIVYPNPVSSNKLQLRLNKQIPGQYKAIFFNNKGQQIFVQQWQHNGDFVNKIFELPPSIAAGIYQLEIVKPDKKKKTISVTIQR